jgi:peptidoglycan/LPS O-acetylase OafA/YrhL
MVVLFIYNLVMGLLRLLLALSVFLTHIQPFWNINLLNGGVAVDSFFIISGFYMALILKEKYIGKGAYKLFITNRFLRIFPTYWVVLLLVILFILIKFFFLHGAGDDNVINSYLHFFTKMPPLTAIIGAVNYISRNITFLFTIDYFYIFTHEPRSFLVQQSWTLQLELLFYLVAPFFVKRSVFFLVIFICLAKLVTQVIPFPYNQTLLCNFTYSLVFFLAGVISYKFYTLLKERQIARNKLLLIFIGFIFITFSFDYLSLLLHLSFWFYFLGVGLTIPFIFLLTQRSRLDQFLGNLSYPFYISHLIFIKILYNTPLKDNNLLFSFTALALSLIASIAIFLLVEKPIDYYRQKRIRKLYNKN